MTQFAANKISNKAFFPTIEHRLITIQKNTTSTRGSGRGDEPCKDTGIRAKRQSVLQDQMMIHCFIISDAREL